MKKIIEEKQKNIAIVEEELQTIPIIEITDQKSLEEATVVRSKLNKLLDRTIEEKEKLTKPLNQTLKEIRDRYRPIETALSSRIESIKQATNAYQTALLASKQAKVESITQNLRDGSLSLDNALEAINELPTAPSKVSTDSGSLSFRPHQKLKVTDITKIPHEYFDLNEKRLLDALKSGKSVEGAEIEIVQVSINRR